MTSMFRMGRSGNRSKDIGNAGQGEGEAPPSKKAKREQTPTGSCVCVWFFMLIILVAAQILARFGRVYETGDYERELVDCLSKKI
jgi:hypothetical protein